MKTTTSEHKTFTTDLGEVEFSVFFERIIERNPPDRLEGHGYHYISQDSEEIRLTEVFVVIPHGDKVDILPQLNWHQKENIISNIE